MQLIAVRMCSIGMKCQYACRAVSAYAHDFWKCQGGSLLEHVG